MCCEHEVMHACADVEAMGFADDSFDLVVDKATLDAVFIHAGTEGESDSQSHGGGGGGGGSGAAAADEGFGAVERMLSEARRVLVDGGVFVSVSHSE
jgi:SAM-dependent methyltransferase